MGWFQPRRPNPEGKARARPRQRWRLYRKGLRVFANWKQVLSLFHCVTDGLQRGPPSSIPLQGEVPDGGPHGRLNSGELDLPEGAKTGASLRFTPDSTPEKYFPSLNFWIGALQLSAHGDRGET
jgi:hypothetical protein